MNNEIELAVINLKNIMLNNDFLSPNINDLRTNSNKIHHFMQELSSVSTGSLQDEYLIAHKNDKMLGYLKFSHPYYPMIHAEAPVIYKEDAFELVTQALLSAIKDQAIKHSCIEVDIIQDMITTSPVTSYLLNNHGFRNIGQSIYLSKELSNIESNPSIVQLEVINANDAGIDRFIIAMVECSQAPILDPRTQPRCISKEGAALTIRDFTSHPTDNINHVADNCYIAFLHNNAVAVAIADAGFVSWLAVRPDQRHNGIARSLLLNLENTWIRQGITNAGLQVMNTNKNAAKLYYSLGYRDHERNSPSIWRWSIFE